MSDPRPIKVFELLDNPDRLIEVGNALRGLKQNPGYVYLVQFLTAAADSAARRALRETTVPREYFLGIVELAESLPKEIDDLILAAEDARKTRDTTVERELKGMGLGGGSPAV